MLFRILVVILIAVSVVWVMLNIRRGIIMPAAIWKKIKNEFRIFKNLKGDSTIKFFTRFRKMIYLLTMTLFLILAVTSYLQIVMTGGPLSGWLLIIHVSAAPFFAISLMMAILLWAHLRRFDQQDWQYLQQVVGKKKIPAILAEKNDVWEKLNFWLFMVSAIPAILSIIFQLYPVFDTDGMKFLLQVHRYSTLILFILVLNHGRWLVKQMNQN